LCEALGRDGVVLYAYCLMPNHVHLLNPVKTEETAAWSAERKWAYLRQYRWSSLSGYVGRDSGDVPWPAPLERIAAAVAEAYGVRPESLPCARKRVGMARGVFIELACTLGGLTRRDVARRLGTMTEHGVGKQRGLVRSALAGDTRLRAEFDALRDRTNSKI
jgi:hypothetical protein